MKRLGIKKIENIDIEALKEKLEDNTDIISLVEEVVLSRYNSNIQICKVDIVYGTYLDKVCLKIVDNNRELFKNRTISYSTLCIESPDKLSSCISKCVASYLRGNKTIHNQILEIVDELLMYSLKEN